MPQAAGPSESAEPAVSPENPTVPPKKRNFLPWIIIGGVVILLFFISIFFGTRQSRQESQAPTPTPSIATGSAISNRVLSAIATESSFMKFEADLDALTRATANTQIQNSQLLPPRIDLPLGF